MAKQSSLDWLIDQVEDYIGLIPVDIIEQAKQMHKEEIGDAISYGLAIESGYKKPDFSGDGILANYYTNTFEQ